MLRPRFLRLIAPLLLTFFTLRAGEQVQVFEEGYYMVDSQLLLGRYKVKWLSIFYKDYTQTPAASIPEPDVRLRLERGTDKHPLIISIKCRDITIAGRVLTANCTNNKVGSAKVRLELGRTDRSDSDATHNARFSLETTLSNGRHETKSSDCWFTEGD